MHEWPLPANNRLASGSRPEIPDRKQQSNEEAAMSDETKKKGTFGNWLMHVALWLAVILFAMNQGAQVADSKRSERFTVRASEGVVCVVVVEGRTQSMQCFDAEDEE
jgi:hypothetical protein